MLEEVVIPQQLQQAAANPRIPRPSRRPRKVGGIITNQLSDGFKAIEAAFAASSRLCIACPDQRAGDGGPWCGTCKTAQRRQTLTAAEHKARRAAAVEAASFTWF
jgi:hypothetical protein